MLSHEQVRRHVSIDFTVPEEHRERAAARRHDEFVVPLAWLTKRPLVHFDLRNEEQHAIPLLTAEQHRTIARELLYRQLDETCEQDVDDGRGRADRGRAGRRAAGRRAARSRARGGARDRAGRLPRDAPSCCRSPSSLWAIVRGLDRRRVFKFAFDEPSARPSFVYVYRRAGLHRGGELPRRGRGARGSQGAHRRCCRCARPAPARRRRARDADRPALYVSDRPGRPPGRPSSSSTSAPSAGASSAPAALVGSIITLLVARRSCSPTSQALPDTAGSGHRPRALHLGRVLGARPAHRRAPAAAPDARPLPAAARRQHVATLFAAASLGFQTAAWIIEGDVGARRACLRR